MSMANKTFKEKIKITLLANLYKLYFFPLVFFAKPKNIYEEYYEGPAIYAIWHGKQYSYLSFAKEKDFNINLLISPSNDGEAIAQLCKSLGYSLIRGSTNRQGFSAIREILRKFKKGESVAYTVDGPRGPIYKVKEGIIKIAQMSQVPIIPINSACKYYTEVNSWDKYNIAWVASPMIVVFGKPIYVPRDSTEEQLEECRLELENKLFELETTAKNNL